MNVASKALEMRLFLFKLAFNYAHKSMLLGDTFPASNLPECYSIERYNSEKVKALKRFHIVVGKSEFIYWYQDGDHHDYWSSTVSNDIDEFIKLFHRDKIYGQFAPYSSTITQTIYGSYFEFAKSGKVNEFDKKKQEVESTISFLLNRYLSSYKHKALKFLINLAS